MTPREIADLCCDHCRALPGIGPWCGRCGREITRRKRGDEGTAFVDPWNTCPPCRAELEAEPIPRQPDREVLDTPPL